MNTLIKITVPLLAVLFSFNNLLSQIDINGNYGCYHPYSLGPESYNYTFKPSVTTGTTEKLKILIAYICFADDNYPPIYDNFWQPHQKPLSPSGGPLIALDKGNPAVFFMDRYPDYTISDYYCEMSMGKLDIVGDEVLVNLPYSSEYYRTNPATNCYGKMNNYVLQYIDDNFPAINFANYDNWRLNGTTWEMISDQKVDFVVMAYRFIPNQGPGPGQYLWFWPQGADATGEATLGQSWGGFVPMMLDNVNLYGNFDPDNSGCTNIGQLLNYSGVSNTINHEFGHSLFTNNIWGGLENHTDIGLMTSVNGTCFNMSPYERSQPILGWNINPDVITSTTTWLIEDFIKNGRILKIPVPNSVEEFWIANHQKISKYDGISRGGKNCYAINRGRQNPYCGDGKGLFIYHHSGYYCYVNGHRHGIEQADGKWNWIVDRWVPYYVPGYDFCIPLFEHGIGNPLYGKDEYMLAIENITNPPQCGWAGWWAQEVSDNPCSENPRSYFVTLDAWGDGLDAFNVGYDEIFSPYSNPRSNTCANPQNNTAITVRLLSQDEQGNIMVKIYFEDNIALQECPPSKPKNLKATKEIINPTTGLFHPKLTWDGNIEPDFTSGDPSGFYKIYRGISYSCDPDVQPTYYYVATISSNYALWIDENVFLYPAGGGSGSCTYQYRSYSYKIEAVDNTGLASLKSDRAIINGYTDPCAPLDGGDNQVMNESTMMFSISNYPNPFNPSTEISFTLPLNGFVIIKVYNMIGEVIATLVNNEYKNRGNYSVIFDGSNFASGIYFYMIQAGDYVATKKMVLLK